MRVSAILTAAAIAAVAIIGFAGGASAQATRTWVSGVGDDANPCSRTAPCKTFAGAISKTAAGGEINCIDPGGFGGVTITKAMTIACEDVEAGILNASSSGVIVNAGAADVVVLRGLDFDSTPAGPGLNGIRFLAGAALHVEDCVIRDNGAALPNGHGILFAPSSGIRELFVRDTVINGNAGRGIEIKPTGTGGATVVVERSSLLNSQSGFKADGTTSTGTINATIVDSVVSGNTFTGIIVQNPLSGGPSINIMADRVALTNNGASGALRVDGANTTIRVGSSTISGNALGTAAVNAGVILSYGDNQIDGNANNGPNPPTTALK